MLAAVQASHKRTDELVNLMDQMEDATTEAFQCCEWLNHRAKQLDALTSPASDASSMLSRANANLAATLILMKDAREKFDTVQDCEPAMERLDKGVKDLEESGEKTKKKKSSLKNRVVLTEQDVYAAGDSIEILRDAFQYFNARSSWRSAPSTLSALERLHKMGVDAMCSLIQIHLKKAGPAVRPKRNLKKEVLPADETAQQTRERLADALQNRDLLKSIGESEEYQPIEARPIREIRSIFDCLGSHGYTLGPIAKREPVGLLDIFGVPAHKVARIEKVGAGSFINLMKQELRTGFPQLDAYGESRKFTAYFAMDAFYKRIKQDRKKKLDKAQETAIAHAAMTGTKVKMVDDADAAARDAVRCLEHSLVIVAGEKSVYRTIISPSLAMRSSEGYDEDEAETSPFFKKACVGAYAHVVGTVIDRTLDIIETVFLKECGIGQTSGKEKNDRDKEPLLTVRAAASAASAGLRMLDGVRMLGPSLAKLSEMTVGDGQTDPNTSIAASLCIAIHRTTVKNSAKTLENLAKAIQDDPLKGPLHRPKDASVSTVTSDVVHAIRLVSPFVSAYKSVSKRRALPWDPNIGDDAGELDSFVRYLVMRLFNSLKGKALNYTKDQRDDSQAKSNLFLLNNAFHLLEELGPDSGQNLQLSSKEHYRIEGSWFVDKVQKLMESEKNKYLLHWEALNTHLTAVANQSLEYQKNDSNILSHDSGRLIKERFKGFNEDFERTYALHKKLCVIDPRLRLELQQAVNGVFLPRYRRFHDKYTKIRFSKKNQEAYTKYHPDRIEEMLADLYVDPE